MIPPLPFVANRVDRRSVEEQLNDMTHAYLGAARWTEELTGEWAPEARELARFECAAFLHLARWNIQSWTVEQLGHDFWLTRNGHGTGFWDRDFGTELAREVLTDLAHSFGEADASVGDDGLIRFS